MKGPSLPTVLFVAVTPEDIAQGEQRSAKFCPIARAINRSLRESLYQPTTVLVSPMHVLVGISDSVLDVLYDVPEYAVEWLHRFDDGAEVYPEFFRFVRV